MLKAKAQLRDQATPHAADPSTAPPADAPAAPPADAPAARPRSGPAARRSSITSGQTRPGGPLGAPDRGARDTTTQGDRGKETRERLIDGAIDVLRAQGFAGATARAVAGAAGCNQALVFYHFGSVQNLLVTALARVSERRATAFGPILDGIGGPDDLVAAAGEVHRADLESGNVAVLAEMLAGAGSDPELARQVADCIRPWFAVARASVERAVPRPVLDALLGADEAAFAVVALFVGMELLSRLDPGADRTEALLDALGRLARLAGLVAGGTGGVDGIDGVGGIAGDQVAPSR